MIMFVVLLFYFKYLMGDCFVHAEIIGALISILIIWVATAVLVGLAIQRVRYPGYEIEGMRMIVTASVAVVFNIV